MTSLAMAMLSTITTTLMFILLSSLRGIFVVHFVAS